MLRSAFNSAGTNNPFHDDPDASQNQDVSPFDNTQSDQPTDSNSQNNNQDSDSVFVDGLVLSDNSPIPLARDRFKSGTATVHVYYCAPSDKFTVDDLDGEISRLNRTVKSFFLRESSNLATVNFVRGGIVSPSGVDWNNTTIYQWRNDVINHTDNYKLSSCWNVKNNHSEVLILADLNLGRTWGFAQLPGTNSVTGTAGKYRNTSYFLKTVAHEIGHSLFNLDHTAETDSECTSEVLHSLMNSPACSSGLTLDTSIVACAQRNVLDWPCNPSNPEPVPDPIPPQGSVALTVGTSAQGQTDCSDAACRFLDVSLSGFSSGSHTLECWSTRGHWATVTTSQWPSTQDCWFGYPGTDVWVVVDGVRSNTVNWPQPTPPPAPTPQPEPRPERHVVLEMGDDARGEGGCRSANIHCRWLSIRLVNFASGSYQTECAHEGVNTPAVQISPSTWVSTENSTWPANRLCWIGYEGTRVYAVVDGVRSNTVVWRTSQPQPPPQPQVDVTLTKGPSAQGQSGCSSVYCRFLNVTLTGFSSGSHTLECWSTRGRWASRTTSQWPSTQSCWFGYPGTDVWVVVDGVRSNTVSW